MSSESQNIMPKVEPTAAHKMEKRDGEIYVALGLFILAVSIPVLIGTYFALGNHVSGTTVDIAGVTVKAAVDAGKDASAAVINFVCGATLFVIGVSAITYGRFVLARNKRRS